MSDSTHGISAEELKAIVEAKKRYMDALVNGTTGIADLAREYHDLALNILLGDHVEGGVIPGPQPGCGPNPDLDNTHMKEGGWGGDTASPELWESVPMRDDPNQWKVVDKEGKNIAHKFATEAEADKYIKYYQCQKEQGTPGGPTEPPVEPPVEPPTEPPTSGEGTDGPYPIKGTKMTHKIRRAIRHYSSGKEDDQTIEANIKNITYKNYQFVVDITIHEMEHDDTASLKYGGTHMGTGWFDHSVGIYTGKTGLGNEPDHPSTNLYIVKGPAIGDIRNKRIKIGGVYFTDQNKCELWTNLGDGWKKQIEGTNVGGFNPKSATDEAQLRIDGFKKGSEEAKPPEPEIFEAFVTEI